MDGMSAEGHMDSNVTLHVSSIRSATIVICRNRAGLRVATKSQGLFPVYCLSLGGGRFRRLFPFWISQSTVIELHWVAVGATYDALGPCVEKSNARVL